MRNIAAFAIGLLFGLGLTISQMVNPAKVLAFLDLLGNWDPSLALVMASAIPVTALGYRLSFRRAKPWLADRFVLATRTTLDPALVVGAVLFGAGWGLGGYCPGPALSGLGIGGASTWTFVAAMLVGMSLPRLTSALRPAPAAAPGES